MHDLSINTHYESCIIRHISGGLAGVDNVVVSHSRESSDIHCHSGPGAFLNLGAALNFTVLVEI